MLPTNLTALEDVPDTVVDAVLVKWGDLVQTLMDRDWPQLVDGQPWLFVESMEYLVYAILHVLGIEEPAAVSQSILNSVVDGGDCEILIVWNKDHVRGHMEPFNIAEDCCVMRLIDMPWPSMIGFLTEERLRVNTIKNLIWRMSAALEVMPKEQR